MLAAGSAEEGVRAAAEMCAEAVRVLRARPGVALLIVSHCQPDDEHGEVRHAEMVKT